MTASTRISASRMAGPMATLIDGVDFPYLARVTDAQRQGAGGAGVARPACRPASTIEGQVSPDTTIKWKPVAGATGYSRLVAADDLGGLDQQPRRAGRRDDVLALKGIDIDSWFFGVSAIGADGRRQPGGVPGSRRGVLG